MRFFKCGICAEKDARIADLQEQISFLRQQLSPPTSADRIPIIQLEADGVLSAQQHVIEIPNASERAEQAAEEATFSELVERDRLLSAAY